MGISVGTGSNAIKAKSNTIRLHYPINPDDFAEARNRLTQSLQTSLELDRLLGIFFDQIQELVTVQGIALNLPGNVGKVVVGHESPHRINYRMNTAQDNLGELTFCRNKRYSELEMSTIEGLISTLVYPLRNALQYREALQTAMRDSLTGVGNRIALDTALEREIQLAQRNQQPLSLLAIDIDHFKRINDKYGHTCGDDVLKEVALSIRAITRATDLTFRYGGEEFVVLLNKTDRDGAKVIAERIRQFVEQVRVETGKEQLKTTISIGCSTLQANESSRELFQRADEALYDAKNSGRNRIELAPLGKQAPMSAPRDS